MVALAARVLSMAALLVTWPSCSALDNGVARTPPMGYNSWYDLGGGSNLNETTLRATADAMVAKGLVAAGFTHLYLDGGFIAPTKKQLEQQLGELKRQLLPDPGGRLPNGSLAENRAKFPSGMGALSAYLRGKGISLGLYTARGRLTCCGLVGSLGHEAEDARRFAVDWNAGYLKVDSCHGTPPDPKGSPPGAARHGR
jgi:alpha-galactosidase